MPKLIDNESEVKRILDNSGVEVYFFPLPSLKLYLQNDEHPAIKRLPKQIKATLLAGFGVYLDKELVKKFLAKTLDQDNAFILEHGEIRMVETNQKIIIPS
jgi:hypothetical protein